MPAIPSASTSTSTSTSGATTTGGTGRTERKGRKLNRPRLGGPRTPACSACQKRRVKCDGGDPCSSCVRKAAWDGRPLPVQGSCHYAGGAAPLVRNGTGSGLLGLLRESGGEGGNGSGGRRKGKGRAAEEEDEAWYERELGKGKGREREADKEKKPLQKGLACLACKSRRVRCDGLKPACTSCMKLQAAGKAGAECVYRADLYLAKMRQEGVFEPDGEEPRAETIPRCQDDHVPDASFSSAPSPSPSASDSPPPLPFSATIPVELLPPLPPLPSQASSLPSGSLASIAAQTPINPTHQPSAFPSVIYPPQPYTTHAPSPFFHHPHPNFSAPPSPSTFSTAPSLALSSITPSSFSLLLDDPAQSNPASTFPSPRTPLTLEDLANLGLLARAPYPPVPYPPSAFSSGASQSGAASTVAGAFWAGAALDLEGMDDFALTPSMLESTGGPLTFQPPPPPPAPRTRKWTNPSSTIGEAGGEAAGGAGGGEGGGGGTGDLMLTLPLPAGKAFEDWEGEVGLPVLRGWEGVWE
ncbi:hypothetical protein JCM11641_004628 [Rhodosporidiobolus odoratus]